MSPLVALAVALGITLTASTLTAIALREPLRRQLAALCAADTTASFWTRSALAVLYLLPLFVVLVFGLQDLQQETLSAAETARRALAATAFTLACIVIAMGLRLATLRPAGQFDYPPVR